MLFRSRGSGSRRTRSAEGSRLIDPSVLGSVLGGVLGGLLGSGPDRHPSVGENALRSAAFPARYQHATGWRFSSSAILGRRRRLGGRRRLASVRDRCSHARPANRPEGGVAMIRVCLYLRISTDEDHQPTSLRTQRERLERYCEAMEGWHIVHAFEDRSEERRVGKECRL